MRRGALPQCPTGALTPRCVVSGLSQRTNDLDLAAAACRTGTHFDRVDKGPDGIDRLRACGFIFQDLLQVSDLPTIEFWEVGKIHARVCRSMGGWLLCDSRTPCGIPAGAVAWGDERTVALAQLLA
jgi:hypothetical protein